MAEGLTSGLSAVSDVMATCMTTISGNALLMALFATALVRAGFSLVGTAKSSVL